jgi:hypothetical protein
MTLFLVFIVTAIGTPLVIGFGFLVEGWLRKNYPYLVGANPLSQPEPPPRPVLRPKQPENKIGAKWA